MSYSKVYKAESDLTSKKKTSGIQIALYVFLILICLTYILPLLWVLNVSFKTNKEIFTAPFALPEKISFENYSIAWTAGKLGISTLNSFIICCHSGTQLSHRFYGGICHCPSALEGCKACNDIFPYRYDDTCTLCTYPAFYKIFKIRPFKFTFRTYTSLSYLLTSDNHIHYDRFL